MLLDTHSLLWLLDGGARFGPVARRTIETDAEVAYSSISIAEIRIKAMLGKLTVPEDLLARIEQANLQPSAFSAEAADSLTGWPELARHDPFDRLLLAQASASGERLLTADRVLLALPGAPVLDALA